MRPELAGNPSAASFEFPKARQVSIARVRNSKAINVLMIPNEDPWLCVLHVRITRFVALSFAVDFPLTAIFTASFFS